MDAAGLPVSREQLEWFYRRSGTIVRSPFKLNSGWWEPGVAEYLIPNLVAEAAKAIAHAALRYGKKVHRWDYCVPIAAAAGNLNAAELERRARSAEVEQAARASTAEFHALQVTQRPTFVLESGIGDKTVLSGAWKAAPIAAAIQAMIEDEASYQAWAAHFGQVPAA
jgi:hypothetical protein